MPLIHELTCNPPAPRNVTAVVWDCGVSSCHNSHLSEANASHCAFYWLATGNLPSINDQVYAAVEQMGRGRSTVYTELDDEQYYPRQCD